MQHEVREARPSMPPQRQKHSSAPLATVFTWETTKQLAIWHEAKLAL